MTDAETAAGEPRGALSDFDGFYLRTRDRVVVHVAALTGDRIEAADHVQEAYIRAWSRWSRVEQLDDPEAWVRRVAYNLAISRWRRARRTVVRSVPDAPMAEWDPGHGRAVSALAQLPQRQREAVVLHHVVGLSVAEVADELRAAEGTVKSWLSRGRTRLAMILEATDG